MKEQVSAETLTDEDVAALRAALCREPSNEYIRDLVIDCDRVRRAIRMGIGAMYGLPHWYYDTARARISAAINARNAAARKETK